MYRNVAKFANFAKFQKFQPDNLVDFDKRCKNAYLLAKIGADTAENEQHFAEIDGGRRSGCPGPLSGSYVVYHISTLTPASTAAAAHRSAVRYLG